MAKKTHTQRAPIKAQSRPRELRSFIVRYMFLPVLGVGITILLYNAVLSAGIIGSFLLAVSTVISLIITVGIWVAGISYALRSKHHTVTYLVLSLILPLLVFTAIVTGK